MTQYRVYLETTASMGVKVDIDDAGLDPEEARERAIEAAYDIAPRDVCAQCSGWRQPWSLDLGEWETSEEAPVEKVVED